MSKKERLAYINGIKCLIDAPSKYPEGELPAATGAYWDWTAVHVQAALQVHISGSFLSWHRHFGWLLEEALHEQCGYPKKLGLPYWDWLKYQGSLENSTLFDGSATSLGGNGLFNASDAAPTTFSPGDTWPHGTGGGCVTRGPFANLSLPLGPFAFRNAFTGGYSATSGDRNWTLPNPHCLRRDIKDYALPTWSNQTGVDELLNAPNISIVQSTFTSSKALEPHRGLHGGGHFAIGGAMTDFFGSPSDPVFFPHHANIDRLWSQWQAADPANRQYQYNGTNRFLDPPSAPQLVNETVLNFYILGNITMGEVANIMDGPYCYRYV